MQGVRVAIGIARQCTYTSSTREQLSKCSLHCTDNVHIKCYSRTHDGCIFEITPMVAYAGKCGFCSNILWQQDSCEDQIDFTNGFVHKDALCPMLLDIVELLPAMKTEGCKEAEIEVMELLHHRLASHLRRAPCHQTVYCPKHQAFATCTCQQSAHVQHMPNVLLGMERHRPE